MGGVQGFVQSLEARVINKIEETDHVRRKDFEIKFSDKLKTASGVKFAGDVIFTAKEITRHRLFNAKMGIAMLLMGVILLVFSTIGGWEFVNSVSGGVNETPVAPTTFNMVPFYLIAVLIFVWGVKMTRKYLVKKIFSDDENGPKSLAGRMEAYIDSAVVSDPDPKRAEESKSKQAEALRSNPNIKLEEADLEKIKDGPDVDGLLRWPAFMWVKYPGRVIAVCVWCLFSILLIFGGADLQGTPLDAEVEGKPFSIEAKVDGRVNIKLPDDMRIRPGEIYGTLIPRDREETVKKITALTDKYNLEIAWH